MRPLIQLRARRGFTMPELLVVAFLIAVAAVAVIAYPRAQRDQAYDYEAAAAIEGVLQAATSAWSVDGRVPASIEPLRVAFPHVTYKDARTVVPTEAYGTHVSVALIDGLAGAVGVAARSASGGCLLTRYELGENSSPQRFGLIPTDGASPCSGATALTLENYQSSNQDSDGGSWQSPIVLP